MGKYPVFIPRLIFFNTIICFYMLIIFSNGFINLSDTINYTYKRLNCKLFFEVMRKDAFRIVRVAKFTPEWKYFSIPPRKRLCVAFDLDRSLIGEDLRLPVDETDLTAQIVLRPGVIEFLKELKERGHKIILWSDSSEEWWEDVRRKFPQLDMFDEYYFKENGLSGRLVTGEEVDYLHFKDIRIVGADFLIDDSAGEIIDVIETENLGELVNLVNNYIEIGEFYCDGVIESEFFKTDNWIFPVAKIIEDAGG